MLIDVVMVDGDMDVDSGDGVVDVEGGFGGGGC